MSELTSLNYAFEYDLPNLSLVLTFMVAAETQEEAIAAFRKRRPHGRLLKLNGQPVKDDGVTVITIDESK
ncbi:MAG: hypothetical protein KDA84_01655 [Planctomycetaceae bacterium]|nr:hypothetical protein [Planctomycetaceae bacterium]